MTKDVAYSGYKEGDFVHYLLIQHSKYILAVPSYSKLGEVISVGGGVDRGNFAVRDASNGEVHNVTAETLRPLFLQVGDTYTNANTNVVEQVLSINKSISGRITFLVRPLHSIEEKDEREVPYKEMINLAIL